MATLACLILTLPLSSLAQDAAPATRHRTSARKPARPSVDERLETLQRALEQQGAQIQALQQQLQQRDQMLQDAQAAARAAQAAAQEAQTRAAAAQTSVETTGAQQQQTVTKIQSDLADVQTTLTNTAVSTQEDQKKVSELSSAFGRFRFTGDIRVRQEDFMQSTAGCPNATCAPRIRERIRLRFGVEGKLNDDFSGGLFLASGIAQDPTSTNETLTNAFERKSIAWDRGYITYNPRRAKWLSLTGGKFAATWQKTNQTFDPDLNPEGFSEKLSFDLKHKGAIKNVTFTAVQLLFNESSKNPDSYAIGAQVGGKLVFGRWTMTPSWMLLNWHRPEALLNETCAQNPLVVFCNNPSTTTSATTAIFAPNGMTNSTVGTAGNLRFTGGFYYSDFIVDNTIRTGIAKFPLRIVAEYEQNLAAAEFTATGLDPQDKMYQFDVSVGQAANRGDVQIGYGWARVEQDAVLASIAESDQRAPTNILQNKFYGTYTVQKNVSLAATFWLGRTLNTGLQNAARLGSVPAGQQEPYLKRLQFDVIYKF